MAQGQALSSEFSATITLRNTSCRDSGLGCGVLTNHPLSRIQTGFQNSLEPQMLTSELCEGGLGYLWLLAKISGLPVSGCLRTLECPATLTEPPLYL